MTEREKETKISQEQEKQVTKEVLEHRKGEKEKVQISLRNSFRQDQSTNSRIFASVVCEKAFVVLTCWLIELLLLSSLFILL